MEERKPDKLDKLEYNVFRIVVFIISMYLMYKLLDEHIKISKLIVSLLPNR